MQAQRITCTSPESQSTHQGTPQPLEVTPDNLTINNTLEGLEVTPEATLEATPLEADRNDSQEQEEDDLLVDNPNINTMNLSTAM
jgi:hypothetical protein